MNKRYKINNKIKIFTLIVGGAILFYYPFMQQILFNIGPAKVYAQDFATIFFIIYLIFILLLKKKFYRFKLKSTKYFILFLVWALSAGVRGFYLYGFHTIGEARWYIFIMLYFFFIIVTFYTKKEVSHFIKRVGFYIIIMLFLHFIQFYFLGLNLDKSGRSAFRFINATDALLVSFMFIWFFLNYINNEKHYKKIILYGFLTILFIIIAIVQHRTVWLVLVGGILGTIFLYNKRAFIKIVLSSSFAVVLLFITIPFFTNFVGFDLNESLEKSAVFIQNPEEDATGSWRLIGWQQELEKVKQNPIMGEGLGGYSEWYFNGKWLRVMVHNGYIMNLSKFGIMGLFLLTMGIFYWFKEMHAYILREKDKYFKLIGRALEIFIFMHLIYITFYAFTMSFWIILGLGSVLVLISKKNSERIKEVNKRSIQYNKGNETC